ncbi:zinc-dependent alcohol dehydrogenase [Microbacterium hominis]|uniref:Alcohol dehydrogenase catalytic domain-containing protein n=1 Tax=Microbacterium hominis TaxID=162426 RepID=A0A7D4U723_9MICO|nr:alcohol dehydrogenase catalytic domain-containing protein [Microbacterium hominis]QKJ18906.1 alcohol dehydrogenase catalytic domain-containing protein [Microbacterium hominis]
MKALVITGPGHAEVQDVEPPVAAPGDVVVDVKRAGICGTDMELFTGDMAYYETRHTTFPVRIGHEWMGVVSAVGDGMDASWLGTRVTGDTMLGCGRCRRCAQGLQHVCELRDELGIRDGRPGALAEQVAVPVTSLHRLPDTVDDAMGAMVEPGGNAFRSVEAAALKPGERCLVLGPGTIGLLCGLFAKAAGAEVHLLGRSERSLEFARAIGFDDVWTEQTLPDLPWDAVIEASNAPHLPAKALHLVEPGRRVVYVGLAGTPSLIDTRELALKDVTAVGVLSASPGLAGTVESYAAGAVDPRPLVAATLTLEDLPAILAGERPSGSGAGPKFHVTIGG